MGTRRSTYVLDQEPGGTTGAPRLLFTYGLVITTIALRRNPAPCGIKTLST